MAQPNQDDIGETFETVEASAGAPQRLTLQEAMLAAVPEPSNEELDARQAEFGESRRSGPPLPEGAAQEELALEAAEAVDEPTVVAEPRPQDL